MQSQAAPVRSACSSALLQFLLDYPLGGWGGRCLHLGWVVLAPCTCRVVSATRCCVTLLNGACVVSRVVPCRAAAVRRRLILAGEKRLQEHLQFLLTNLSYEHERCGPRVCRHTGMQAMLLGQSASTAGHPALPRSVPSHAERIFCRSITRTSPHLTCACALLNVLFPLLQRPRGRPGHAGRGAAKVPGAAGGAVGGDGEAAACTAVLRCCSLQRAGRV